MDYSEDFFEFCRAREDLRRRKEAGEDWPWSDDPVLNYCRIGNIHREDDTATAWFRNSIRDHLGTRDLVFACVAFRWFNNQQVGEIMQPYLLGDWNERQVLGRILNLERYQGPIEGSRAKAYMQLMRPLLTVGPLLGVRGDQEGYDLETMFNDLLPHMREQLAYDVVSDLRHTCVLDQAQDVNTWAPASPGACRGMGLVVSDDESEYLYGHDRTNRAMLPLMQRLLTDDWEMVEVETALRLFYYYRSAQRGGNVPRKYKCHG